MAESRAQFCPFCGTPIAYDAGHHHPRYETIAAEARARGSDPPALPERVRDALSGDSWTGVCQGCRTISHVVGHHAG